MLSFGEALDHQSGSPLLTTWLDGSAEEALALVRLYSGEMTFQVATPPEEIEISINC